jgi:type VI protein secretion system component Hcp
MKTSKQSIMRSLILILLFFPLVSFSQKANTFIKLIDSRGQQIKGDAFLKGYENWISATTISSAGKNNTQLSFTMTITGASAELKRAMANGETLLGGQVTVLDLSQNTYIPIISYTIKMENIVVSSCSEAMGCDNVMNTTVTLQATRIGWTYYQIGKTGTQAISRKFGWDTGTQTEWTNF